MMGGDLQVESRTEGPDHGSCFTLSFPYRPSEIKVAKQDLGDHLEEHRLRRQSTGRLVRTILVVEDDSVSRRMMLRMLEKSGYEAIAARNGQEGVEMYKDTPDIDLILMDVVRALANGENAFCAFLWYSCHMYGPYSKCQLWMGMTQPNVSAKKKNDRREVHLCQFLS
jgi:hypothetical protein